MAILFVVLVACGEPVTEEESAIRGSRLACDHFRNVMRDVSDGILTPEELRGKLQEVDDNASIGTPEVQTAATDMLRAATQDEGDAFVTSVASMDSACESAGH